MQEASHLHPPYDKKYKLEDKLVPDCIATWFDLSNGCSLNHASGFALVWATDQQWRLQSSSQNSFWQKKLWQACARCLSAQCSCDFNVALAARGSASSCAGRSTGVENRIGPSRPELLHMLRAGKGFSGVLQHPDHSRVAQLSACTKCRSATASSTNLLIARIRGAGMRCWQKCSLNHKHLRPTSDSGLDTGLGVLGGRCVCLASGQAVSAMVSISLAMLRLEFWMDNSPKECGGHV